ncbi:uncharacterized protein [Mytilus edulis]|uniref:uncharacterized protein n=1 Tax=Mytilus edulis TaxID=6550 RepID=UPI0039EFB199
MFSHIYVLSRYPFTAHFCGIDLILRVSILFYAYALITQYGPNFLRYILPYLNLSLLVLTLIYLPINLVPYPLVWLYDKILWVTEPALMIAEIVLALNFVMHCGQRVIEKMEEDDSNVWKILTIGFSSLCYATDSFSIMGHLSGRHQRSNDVVICCFDSLSDNAQHDVDVTRRISV